MVGLTVRRGRGTDAVLFGVAVSGGDGDVVILEGSGKLPCLDLGPFRVNPRPP